MTTGAARARALAKRRWLAGERIDMSALAAELGVSRVTLYRHVGSREALLSDVIWEVGERTLVAREAAARPQDGHLATVVVSGFIEDTVANSGMRRFLAAESDLALRLLTRGDGGFQPRLIAWVRAMLDRAPPPRARDVPPDDLAFVVVRIAESYVYTDILTGEAPDPDRARVVLRALLG